MFISQDELIKRLDRPTNLVKLSGKELADTRPVVASRYEDHETDPQDLPTASNNFYTYKGKKRNLTPMGREMIGIAANLTDPRQAAAAFGCSVETAMALKEGKVPTHSVNGNGREDPELKRRIEAGILQVREQCVDRMSVALGGISDAKLENVDAKTLSVITANLARTLTSTDKKDLGGHVGQVVFVVPPQAPMAEYPVIDLEVTEQK